MILAHGGTAGALAEFLILFVPLAVVFYLARKKSKDDADEDARDEEPRSRES
jgi:cbb3-type cytochrome oxidase subunit 3